MCAPVICCVCCIGAWGRVSLAVYAVCTMWCVVSSGLLVRDTTNVDNNTRTGELGRPSANTNDEYAAQAPRCGILTLIWRKHTGRVFLKNVMDSFTSSSTSHLQYMLFKNFGLFYLPYILINVLEVLCLNLGPICVCECKKKTWLKRHV